MEWRLRLKSGGIIWRDVVLDREKIWEIVVLGV